MNSEDLINELFPFKKPLTSRYRKKYVEFLALGILQYCCGDTYVGFNVYDASDDIKYYSGDFLGLIAENLQDKLIN